MEDKVIELLRADLRVKPDKTLEELEKELAENEAKHSKEGRDEKK